MIFNFSEHQSISNQYVRELRDINIQNDRARFRKNLNRLGQIAAFEISKTFEYHSTEVETPLGTANVDLFNERIVLATILRAGLPLHQGLLDSFDHAQSAFVSAYRQHHKDGTFEISLQYATCPNLDGCQLIITDPMIATGASLTKSIEALLENGTPSQIHVVSAIASKPGLNYVKRLYPNIDFWVFAIDEELTGKSYIVPGLGDAGDLAFGPKEQD